MPMTKGLRDSRSHYLCSLLCLVLCYPIQSACLEDENWSQEVLKCSRAKSRTAQAILDKYVLPVVRKHGYDLPPRCRLHPRNNMFAAQEGSKVRASNTNWQCGLCQKRFKGEEYLDKHLNNRHLSNVTKGVPCAADLCPLIHCRHLDKDEPRHMGARCKPSEMERRQHECQALANACFPASKGNVARFLNDFFLRQVCDAHTCGGKPRYFPLGAEPDGHSSFYWSVALFVSMLLGVFYVALYQERRSTQSKRDLRRVSVSRYPRRRSSIASWLELLHLPRKDKVY